MVWTQVYVIRPGQPQPDIDEQQCDTTEPSAAVESNREETRDAIRDTVVDITPNADDSGRGPTTPTEVKPDPVLSSHQSPARRSSRESKPSSRYPSSQYDLSTVSSMSSRKVGP